MLTVFEVHLAPGADPDELLSAELLRETQAQVMTLDEAKAVGFSGLPPAPAGQEVRLVAVSRRDARWMQQSLERNAGVASFRAHEVET